MEMNELTIRICPESIGWCDRSALLAAGIPSNWIAAFRESHPESTRKLGDAQQSKRLYRVADVNAAIERGEVFP